ncbi:MAG: hypothetical protein JWO31_2087, partial [Phycisphaerales bacterium]|nr:hypothetical protein [Phycisphaerales bacterium]
CAVPAVSFFVALSPVTPMLASWPMPSFAPLVVLVAVFAAGEFRRPGGPDVGFRRAWRAAVVYGLGGWLVLSFPNALALVPGAAHALRGPLRRIAGHREAAAELAEVLGAVRTPDGRPPLIVARYYMTAAEYAFYLPGHPTVYNAGRLLGKRPSSYDFWHETDLTDPALAGRTAVLDGRGSKGWEEILRFDSVAPLAGGRAYLGRGFRGVAERSHRPRSADSVSP